MKSPFPVVHIVLAVPVADLSAYSDAVRCLSRKLGRRAPDIFDLMAHTLRCRDSKGLVEDYLESIDGPASEAKASPQSRVPRKPLPNQKRINGITLIGGPTIIPGRN
ncbi:MAG: hypothetical protein F9K30_22830 [Dechloromonas sp.]|nr:MAG: hypothetical protein F9K30_22830 [Dechloromonas sp.]